MMEAVGVPFRKISFVQLYSVLSLYWKSIVIGILLSIAACFGIWIMMRESNTFFADFSVKWTQILLTCLVIGLAFAVIAIPLHRLLRKNSILDALQQE
jgi:ABC-type antimicrobial peptide transport system permease subunit